MGLKRRPDYCKGKGKTSGAVWKRSKGYSDCQRKVSTVNSMDRQRCQVSKTGFDGLIPDIDGIYRK